MTKSDEPVVVNAPVWLRFLVYIMGFVLVALFIFVLIAIFYKANTYTPPSAQNVVMGLGLPPDAQFRDVTLNGDRLTVNAGKSVYVIDVPSHRIILRVDGKTE
jgi:hypothetical protein